MQERTVDYGKKAQLRTPGIMTDEKRKALSLHVGQAVAVGASDSISYFLSRYRRTVQNDVQSGYLD